MQFLTLVPFKTESLSADTKSHDHKLFAQIIVLYHNALPQRVGKTPTLFRLSYRIMGQTCIHLHLIAKLENLFKLDIDRFVQEANIYIYFTV